MFHIEAFGGRESMSAFSIPLTTHSNKRFKNFCDFLFFFNKKFATAGVPHTGISLGELGSCFLNLGRLRVSKLALA